MTLLDDGLKHVCVYCEWHDDFVIEIGDDPTKYLIHHVKARASSQGPWTFQGFFGVAKKRSSKAAKEPPTIAGDAIAPLMLLHHRKFNESCAGVAFVTNAGVHPVLDGFLRELRNAGSLEAFAGDDRASFDHIAHAYLALDEPLASSPEELFHLLGGISIERDRGNLTNEELALIEIGILVEQ